MFLSGGGEESDTPVPSVLDALTDPDGTAYLLSTLPPSPGGVAAAAAVGLAGLSAGAGVDLLVALEAHIAWLTAHQQRLLAHLQAVQDRDGDPSDPVTQSWLREEVSCALHLAGGTARARIEVATVLAKRLPATLALLSAGRIGYGHARALADAVVHLDQDATAAVETRVLGRAAGQSVGEFRAAITRAVAAVDSASSAEERHRRAVADRRVAATPVGDGMTELWALLPAPGAAVVMEAIQTLASVTSADDARTIDQRRADALVSLGSAVLHDPHAPRAQGLRPHIQVTVAATTLLGLDNTPADLDGYGPIPATLARDIAADPTGTWRRILTDPTSGTLLDYGTTRYRPPPPLAAHVMARDRECSFPHCHRRAYHCDLDHLTRWTDNGRTTADNLHPLCPRHHRAKDDHHWHVHRDPATGSFTWTSPHGHHYTKTIPRYHHPDHTPTHQADSHTSDPPTSDTPTSRPADPDQPPF